MSSPFKTFDNESDDATRSQVVDTEFDTTDPALSLGASIAAGSANFHTEYATPGGAQVTVNWTVVQGSNGFPSPRCALTGHAIGVEALKIELSDRLEHEPGQVVFV